MNLPESLLEELSQVSEKLNEIYNDACKWETENII